MFDWLRQHETLMIGLGVFSIASLVLVAILLPVIVVRLPADHFVREHHVGEGPRGWLDWIWHIGKNLLGFVFVLGGLAMLVLPGQGVLTIVIGILMMPWKLMASADAYIFNWLVGYSALLGPVAGIMICDYFVIRDKTLDVPDLYRVSGRYPRWNPVALVALVLGVLPNVPGFLHSTHVIEAEPGFFDDLYVYAWFTGFLLAFGVYWAGTRLTARPAAAA